MIYYDEDYEMWYLSRYKAALDKIGFPRILNIPRVYKEKLQKEKNLIRKVRILEEVAELF